MPRKVELTKTNTYLNIVDVTQDNKFIFSKGDKETYYNPFTNLFDMVSSYLQIYDNQDIEKLKNFVSYENHLKVPNFLSHLKMFQNFVLSMFISSIDPDPSDEWLNFDNMELDKLLSHEFFNEYNKTRPYLEAIYKRAYPMLDVYSFIKLEAYATKMLPVNSLWDIHYIWTFEDFIEIICNLKWYEVIATAYQSLGIHWFTYNAENDPILYKWACYAIIATKQTNIIDYSSLKKDLIMIYKELLIALTIRDSLDKNVEIINYVQDCITNFESINHILLTTIKQLKCDQNSTIDRNKQLSEGKKLLKSQIKDLQNKGISSEEDILNEITQKIYALLPQDLSLTKTVYKFSNIWDKLDDATKKDIKTSLDAFETLNSFDIALFPMIRSLEHEFNINFFEPFHTSQAYKNVKNSNCLNPTFQKTHNSLLKKMNIHPTMGTIPFIGRAVNSIKAQEASPLIKAFATFLGNKKNQFIAICKLLDSYKLGSQKYRLVELRNGIAHGDTLITKNIDPKCYKDVAKLLYDPPLQILFKIINASRVE